MPQIIEVPGMGQVEFPDDMNDDQIASAIKANVKPDYDYDGARAAGVSQGENGHWPDTYKLPNHITFSSDSKYSKPGQEGGTWSQAKGKWHYKPSAFVLSQHSPEELQQYFARNEPDSVLDLPAKNGPGPWSPARLPHSMDEAKSYALNLLRGNVRNVGLAGRTALNAVTALPLAAMDAGVGVRNYIDEKRQPKQLSELITGPKQFQGYELPSQTWGRAMDELGMAKPENFTEKAADFVGQMAVGGKLPAPEAAVQAPAAFDPKAMRTLALQKAQEAGYVVPPSTTNPTLLNRFLESWGGKTGTAQDASARNQAVTDALVKKDLGLGATDDVAEGTLPFLRSEAAQNGYGPVRNVGTIRLDSKFETDIDDAVGQLSKVAQKFPKLAKSDVTDTIASLKAKSIDSDTAVDTISVLRANADEAYAAGEKQAGAAYKAAAKAMEDAIERSLGRRGADAQGTLSNFRDARQMIAKTYSAQKALNPELGNFDARKLAQLLNQGKPLTGGMKQAGQFAQAFKEASKLATDSGSVRNTDVILGTGAAALSGNPMPLIYPFTRMAARDLLLSGLGQKLAVPRSTYGLPPELLMAGSTGLLGSQ